MQGMITPDSARDKKPIISNILHYLETQYGPSMEQKDLASCTHHLVSIGCFSRRVHINKTQPEQYTWQGSQLPERYETKRKIIPPAGGADGRSRLQIGTLFPFPFNIDRYTCNNFKRLQCLMIDQELTLKKYQIRDRFRCHCTKNILFILGQVIWC